MALPASATTNASSPSAPLPGAGALPDLTAFGSAVTSARQGQAAGTAGPPPAPASQSGTPPADPNTQQIQQLLNEPGPLPHGVANPFRRISAMLRDLPPGQADSAVRGLGDADLKRLGDGLNSGANLSPNRQRDFFGDLAGKVGGDTLARLSGNLSRDNKGSLAGALTSHGSDEQKAAYVAALAPGMASGTSSTGVVRSEVFRADADNAGRVFASLHDPATISAVTGGLTDGQMGAMLDAGEHIQTLSNGGAATPSIIADARQDHDILATAARGTDPEGKARMFTAGSAALSGLGRLPGAQGQAAEVRDGLTAILGSDTPGVVNALADDTPSRAHGLVGYMQSMIRDGQAPTLGTFVASLQTGGVPGADVAAHLDAQAPDDQGKAYYANSYNLGFFVGAGIGAVNKLNADVKTQADTMRAMFTATFSGVTIPARAVLKVAAQANNGLSVPLVNEVVSGIQAGNKSVADAMIELAVPRDPATHRPMRLAGRVAFQAGRASVAGLP